MTVGVTAGAIGVSAAVVPRRRARRHANSVTSQRSASTPLIPTHQRIAGELDIHDVDGAPCSDGAKALVGPAGTYVDADGVPPAARVPVPTERGQDLQGARGQTHFARLVGLRIPPGQRTAGTTYSPGCSAISAID
jgi:hypothetical protein